jgi:hypothetical protein
LQVPRQEFTDPVDGVMGDAGEHIPQIGFRIEAVQFRGLNQRQDRRSSLSAFV